MTTKIQCTECNRTGGTVPRYYWDDVVEMMHPECAQNAMLRYFEKKEASAHTG